MTNFQLPTTPGSIIQFTDTMEDGFVYDCVVTLVPGLYRDGAFLDAEWHDSTSVFESNETFIYTAEFINQGTNYKVLFEAPEEHFVSFEESKLPLYNIYEEGTILMVCHEGVDFTLTFTPGHLEDGCYENSAWIDAYGNEVSAEEVMENATSSLVLNTNDSDSLLAAVYSTETPNSDLL